MSHLCLLVTNTTTKLSQEVFLHFHRIFFNQLERQATIFDKQNQNLCMKRALSIAPPLGKLDNNLSPRVGDFAQKNHPRPKLPGGGPSGIHLILPLSGLRDKITDAQYPENEVDKT